MTVTLKNQARVGGALSLLSAADGLVITPPNTTPPPATLLFDGRFTSGMTADTIYTGTAVTSAPRGAWSMMSCTILNNVNRLTYVTSPRRRTSGYAAKLEVGGVAGSASDGRGVRIEYGPENFWDNAMEGRELWIAFSSRLHSGTVLPQYVFLFQQNSKFNSEFTDGTGGEGGSQAILLYNNTAGQSASKIKWNITGGNQSPISIFNKYITDDGGISVADILDKWVDWLIHYKFSSTSTNVISELFYRVQSGGTDTAPTFPAWTTALSDTTHPNLVRKSTSEGNFRMQTGLYKPNGTNPFNTVTAGGVVIASTRTDAENGLFS